MKKNYFQVLRLAMLMVLLLLFTNAIEAQTFVCTDLSVYDTNIDGKIISEKEIQKGKNEALGQICTLEFYDNSVKFSGMDDGKKNQLF